MWCLSPCHKNGGKKMFCNQCGTQLPDGSKFCNVCGAKLIVPQTGQQEIPPIQPSYDYCVQQPQPVNERKAKPAKAMKKLPTWAKILIAVCVLAVVGVATFLTIHIIKGKKGSHIYVTIDGVKCEINDEDGISNLDKIEDGIVLTYSRNGAYSCELYKNGNFISNLEPNDVNVRVEKQGALHFDSIKRRIGCLQITVTDGAEFELSDGIGSKASKEACEKNGYIYTGKYSDFYMYSKLFDKNGEIAIDSINADYEAFLENYNNGVDYNLSPGFPEDKILIAASSPYFNKDERRSALIDAYSSNLDVSGISDFDDYFKFKLLFSKEASKLSGMKNNEYVGATSDFLVRVDVGISASGDSCTLISIYAPHEKLNDYMTKWGLPDSTFYVSDAKITTEHYDTQEDATIEIYDPYIEIRPGADIPEEEGNDESTTEVPVTSYEPYDIANLPEGIDDFLGNFGWYSNRGEDYDCEGYIDYDKFYLSFFNNDIGLYNIHYYDNVYISDEALDPLNKFEYAYGLDGYRADFVLKNVYNWSDDMIQAAKDNDDSYYYFYDGNYYAYVGGVGGGYVPEIKSVEFNGTRYHITYDLITYGEGDEFVGTHYAELEYKVIDGKGYWSIYKDSTTPFF